MLFPLAGNWRNAMQVFSQAVDDTMGELVVVTPATIPKTNFPSVPDPSRSVTVVAVFTNKATTVTMGPEGKMGGYTVSPLISTSKPVFDFAYGALPWPIRRSYRLTRLCNGETYEVTDVKPDGVARIVVNVVMLGRASEDY